MQRSETAQDKQLVLLKTVKVLRPKERLALRAYQETLDQAEAYRRVFPGVSERSVYAAASRFFKRIREKLDDPDYLDEFNLGKPRFYTEIDRLLRATKPATRKVIRVYENGTLDEDEESFEAVDNSTRLGALRLLADVHGVGRRSDGTTVNVQTNITTILQAAYESRKDRSAAGEGGRG